MLLENKDLCFLTGPKPSNTSLCPSVRLQQVPGGGRGGAPSQAEERYCRDPALLPGADPLPERLAAQLPVLLQRRAADERAEDAGALLCRSVCHWLRWLVKRCVN